MANENLLAAIPNRNVVPVTKPPGIPGLSVKMLTQEGISERVQKLVAT
jgi:hypothetical protein